MQRLEFYRFFHFSDPKQVLRGRHPEYVRTDVVDRISTEHVIAVKSFAENLCAGVGVTVNVPNVTATSPTAAGVSPTTTTSPAVIGASPTTGAASVMDRRGNAGNMFLVGVVGIIFPWLGF